ncbi:MAG TPA: electron transfer flavoprotein-ubiquinone oxidoreductase [Steroidobacteraceae bacterium]|nr:electron transfer flavoprotein-ubiquinone oxidoreductase [Steroidobacteraceae bacterium]
MGERDSMNYDVAIVGAGPAGLACALRLRQLQPERSICVIEKAASLGAHSISGAVLDPVALDALVPEWRAAPPPTCVPVQRDEFRFLTERRSIRLPTPPQQRNHGNFIVSLSQLVPWLGTRVEAAGVDVFTGFAAASALIDATGAVSGVRLGDVGRLRDGSEGANFTPGAEIHAPVTVLAEGCRGSIAKQLIARYRLDADRSPPTFALGLKELWQLPPGRATAGLVQHTIGWPMPRDTFGGGFIYHLDQDRAYVGLVIGLDYRDPGFAPFEAFRHFKNHPATLALLEGGEPLAYGARAIAAGGAQALPCMEMPGALLIGDAAGTLDAARIKGIHQAMRSGMLAAEHLVAQGGVRGFDAAWRASPGGRALQAVRNIKPGFKHGLWWGLANAALETALGGHTPWTLQHAANDGTLRRLDQESPAVATMNPPVALESALPPRDRTAAVYLASTAHDEQQPVHLHVADTSICAERCAREYGNPCTRFCPAAVYEIIVADDGKRRLQINAANCVHCKACDIKDPYRLITWTTPEGGSGPNYQNL